MTVHDEHLLQLLSQNEYEQFVNLCNITELEFEEDSFIHASTDEERCNAFTFDFYSCYMLVLLFLENLNEAKYLWKRSPTIFKVNQNNKFSLAWEVGKALWKENYQQAITQLSTTEEWLCGTNSRNNEIVTSLVLKLRDQIITNRIQVLVQIYVNITVSGLYETLGVNVEELRQRLTTLGYEIIADTGVVKNNGAANSNIANKTAKKNDLELFQEDITQLQQLSQCIATLESKDPTVVVDNLRQQHLQEQQQQQQNPPSVVAHPTGL